MSLRAAIASPEASGALRVDVGYDGTELAGWATQTGQSNVAGVLARGTPSAVRLGRPLGLTVAAYGCRGPH